MSFTLYKHQQTELELLTDNQYFALFAKQGTGKMLPTLLHMVVVQLPLYLILVNESLFLIWCYT